MPALRLSLSLLLLSALAACGGGSAGSGAKAPGDINPGAPVQTAATAVAGPDSFLLFPNPGLPSGATYETNTAEYGDAYYRAVDPDNARDTLAKWKDANGFGKPAGALGEVAVAMGDQRDLGYGRRMTARQNPDGSIAVLVENFRVETGAGYAYTPQNLDAAVVRDGRWHIGTNAIEYSPGPNGTVKFAKFYNFDPATGERRVMADMDGRGLKAMPGMCINCHGGRADPLTPPGADGKPRFALVANALSGQRGDTQARLHMLDVDSFALSSNAGYTRADLEGAFKRINQMVLCTYPLAGASSAPEDGCRPPAGPNEWQGGADAALKAAYGGPGLPNAVFQGGYVPPGWVSAGQSSLYRNVVQQACITCHALRGTANQADIAFMSYAAFQGYAGEVRWHVFERGDMPLARIVAERFWGSDMAQLTAGWLEQQLPGYRATDGAGALLRPGRPIAVPGPDRVAAPGAIALSGAGSLYSAGYNWTLTGNPGNATLTGAATVTPVLNATAAGVYTLQLVTGNGAAISAPATLKVTVKPDLALAPQSIRFENVRAILAQPAVCAGCHQPGPGGFKPPIFFADIDRNGDGVVDATDRAWLYRELRGRINQADLAASVLLTKPSGMHHAGGKRVGFDSTLPPGDPGRASYDLVLNWVLNGAPF
jgi:mono/diheme cytochrome c family protein